VLHIDAERLHVTDNRGALIVHAVDVVETTEQIVEARRPEQHLDRRVRIDRRVDAGCLAGQVDLRTLEVDLRNDQLVTGALQVASDPRELHVREVPALDHSRELHVDRVDLRNDPLRFGLLPRDALPVGRSLRSPLREPLRTTQRSAGMWRILDRITTPRPGANAHSPGGEGHKVRRVTPFPDSRKARTSQKLHK